MLKKLILQREQAAQQPQNVYYLVQFQKTKTSLIHCIVCENSLIVEEVAYEDHKNSPGDIEEDEDFVMQEEAAEANTYEAAKKVYFYVKDKDTKRSCTVLFHHSSIHEVNDQLNKLKYLCTDGAYSMKPCYVDMMKNPWILVQYNSGTTCVVYAIIQFFQTIWTEANLFDNNEVELIKGEVRAIILFKSHDRRVLELELAKLNNYVSKKFFKKVDQLEEEVED